MVPSSCSYLVVSLGWYWRTVRLTWSYQEHHGQNSITVMYSASHVVVQCTSRAHSSRGMCPSVPMRAHSTTGTGGACFCSSGHMCPHQYTAHVPVHSGGMCPRSTEKPVPCRAPMCPCCRVAALLCAALVRCPCYSAPMTMYYCRRVCTAVTTPACCADTAAVHGVQ